MTWTIYSYWNITELIGVFNAIAAIFGSGGFNGLLRTVVLIMLFSITLVALSGRLTSGDTWKWLIMVVILNGMLLVPKVTVQLEDKTSSQPTAVVSNIPLGIAATASTLSEIGNWLTEAYETVFSLPGGLTLQDNGMMFGHKVQEEMRSITPNTFTWSQDFNEFYRECISPELMPSNPSASMTVDGLTSTNDTWGYMAGKLNPAYIVDLSTGPQNCVQAYGDLTTRLSIEADQALALFAKRMVPTDNPAATKTIALLEDSNQFFLGISASAKDLVTQSLVTNAMTDADCLAQAQASNPLVSTQCTGATIGRAQTNTTQTVLAQIATSSMPKLRNAIELVQYAVAPIVLLLAVAAGLAGLTILKIYIQSLLWVQLWPPLFAVVNYIMAVKAQAFAAQTEGIGNSIAYQYWVQGAMVSEQAIAGMLVMAIPPIAAALVKGGEIGLQAVAGLVSSPRSAEREIAAVGMGNLSMGQVNTAPMAKVSEPNLAGVSVMQEHGTIERAGSQGRFFGSFGEVKAMDMNKDGKFTEQEVTTANFAASSMFGSTAAISSQIHTGKTDYSGTETGDQHGKTATAGDQRTATLTKAQEAARLRAISAAVDNVYREEAGAGDDVNAGKRSGTSREDAGSQALSNFEGGTHSSAVGIKGGGSPKDNDDINDKDSKIKKLGKFLAGLLPVSASSGISIETGQQYQEQFQHLTKGMTSEEIQHSYVLAQKALRSMSQTESDQQTKQGAERLAAALSSAKTFDSKELASLVETTTAGTRDETGRRNVADFKDEHSLDRFKIAWALEYGANTELSNYKIARLAEKWNSSSSEGQQLRDAVNSRLEERLSQDPRLAAGVSIPLTQDQVKGQATGRIEKLTETGNTAVTGAAALNSGKVVNEQSNMGTNPGVAPDTSQVGATAGQLPGNIFNNVTTAIRDANREVNLENGIMATATALYREHQSGLGTIESNALLFGSGSASVENYAAALRNAAASDPELANGLITIGHNFNEHKSNPTEDNIKWVESRFDVGTAEKAPISAALDGLGNFFKPQPEVQAPQPLGGGPGITPSGDVNTPSALSQAADKTQEIASDIAGKNPKNDDKK
jgi:hypothetical protein